MEAESSRNNHPLDYGDSYSEQSNEEHKKDVSFSMDSLLPDDLLERILSYLPIASIFRASSVCKRWNEIVTSRRFLCNFSNTVSQKPWYFMFTNSDDPSGYIYDPILKKWYSFDLPCIETSSWIIASSSGLVCFMDNDYRNKIYVCNPITKQWRKLLEPPGHKLTDYTALATSTNRDLKGYSISIVKSKQVPGNFYQWDLSIHVYNSETMNWVTYVTDVLSGWRGGDESVICNGVLYLLIYSTGGRGGARAIDDRHGLIMINLSSRSSSGSLMKTFVPMPCLLTCGRLMNLKDKLVMVGGIGIPDRPEIVKGIGIWILKEREWEEIGKMPQRFFQGFGELDDVFASSGIDDLIYIQSYGGPALLTFDMNQRLWKWSQKCPVLKRFPLQLFSGFCFQPRLDFVP